MSPLAAVESVTRVWVWDSGHTSHWVPLVRQKPVTQHQSRSQHCCDQSDIKLASSDIIWHHQSLVTRSRVSWVRWVPSYVTCVWLQLLCLGTGGWHRGDIWVWGIMAECGSCNKWHRVTGPSLWVSSLSWPSIMQQLHISRKQEYSLGMEDDDCGGYQ